MHRTAASLIFGAASMLLVACDDVPQREIDGARRALEGARRAQAESYAPTAWNRANVAYELAESEIAFQRSRFVGLRSYRSASHLLNEAKQQALRAAGKADEAHKKKKAEASAQLARARAGVDIANRAIERAPHPSRKALRAELVTLSDSLQAAVVSFERGEYLSAISTAKTVRRRARILAEDLPPA